MRLRRRRPGCGGGAPFVRVGRLVDDGEEGPQSGAAPLRRPDRREHGRAGPDRDPRLRQADQLQRQKGHHRHGDHDPLVRRGDRQDQRRDRALAHRCHRHGDPRADGRGCRSGAVELPDVSGLRRQARAGAGRGQLGHPQARRADPALRDLGRRVGLSGRHSRRRVQRPAGFRRDRGPGARPPRGRRLRDLHGLGRGRQDVHEILGRVQHEAGLARMRRQVAPGGARRLRSRPRGPGRRQGHLLPTRARSATRARGSSSRRRSRMP